jgi:transporter family-2 protein
VRMALILLALTAGAFLPIQSAINAQFAERGATVLWVGVISCVVTAVSLAVAAYFIWRLPPPSVGVLTSVPLWLWTGGILGTVIMVGLIAVAPRIGAALMFVCFVAGIMLCSLALDHFGVLGLPQQSMTFGRAVGAALMLAAAVLVSFY